MKIQEDDAKASHPGDAERRSWIWGLLLSTYFLLLLGVGIWLVTSAAGVSGTVLVAYSALLVVSIAGLLVRTYIFGIDLLEIDRRNFIDLSRAQWLGWRGQRKKDDSGAG